MQWWFVLQVLGRWPAKLYLVMEVPLVSLSGALRERELGLLGFLSADFGAVLESCGLTGWDPVDGISTPFVPIKVRYVECA